MSGGSGKAAAPEPGRALSAPEWRFFDSRRVARLATADAGGRPHVVPVCFVVDPGALYITIDEKPKRIAGARLKRLRNIAENAEVAVLADRYADDDWSRLGWVMVRGPAEILTAGPEHAEAQARLSARYPQLARMALGHLPVIAVRIAQVASWGNLDPAADRPART